MKGKQNKGITRIILVISIIVLIILAGVSINLVLGENGIITNGAMSKKEEDLKTLEKNINEYKDYIRFLDNSMTAYYLENQNENISDVETFLKNYDNNIKLSDLLGSEENTTKEEVLNDEKKLFGYDTNLKFEDVYTNNYKTEGKKEEYLLYKFSDNTFYFNDDCDWESRLCNVNWNSIYHYIIDVKKDNNIITLYSKNLWSDRGIDEPHIIFFASYKDYSAYYNNLKIYEEDFHDYNYVINAEEIWDVPYEEDGKLLYTQALFSYNDILSKLNTYEYKIEVTGDTYRILSYKMIDN